MPTSPRHFAEKLFDAFRQLSREDRSTATFLDLAEAIIHEAIAFELNWLAGYLKERAERMAPRREQADEPQAPLPFPPPALPVPSGQLDQ